MGFWASTATVIGVIGGTAGAIWLGIHFGEKWIDRMFALPAIDASKGLYGGDGGGRRTTAATPHPRNWWWSFKLPYL